MGIILNSPYLYLKRCFHIFNFRFSVTLILDFGSDILVLKASVDRMYIFFAFATYNFVD